MFEFLIIQARSIAPGFSILRFFSYRFEKQLPHIAAMRAARANFLFSY